MKRRGGLGVCIFLMRRATRKKPEKNLPVEKKLGREGRSRLVQPQPPPFFPFYQNKISCRGGKGERFDKTLGGVVKKFKSCKAGWCERIGFFKNFLSAPRGRLRKGGLVIPPFLYLSSPPPLKFFPGWGYHWRVFLGGWGREG